LKIQKSNFFQVSGVTRSSKVESAQYYIKNDFTGDKIYFLHEGKRYKNDLLFLLKKKDFLDINISSIKPGEYVSKLTPLIQNISKNDLLILDISHLKLIHIIDYINKNKKKPTILKLYGLIDGRVNEYNFPIVEIAGERSLNSLSFQALCDLIGENLTSDEKSFILSAIFRFEVPFFLNYVAQNKNQKIDNKNDLFTSLRKDINLIDGINDVFIDKAKTYSFDNNVNTNLTSFNYLIPRSLQEDGQISRIYYPTQFFPQKNKIV